jgi:hypothetical protein
VVVNDSIRAVIAECLEAYPEIASKLLRFIFFNTQTHDYFQPIKQRQFITITCQSE